MTPQEPRGVSPRQCQTRGLGGFPGDILRFLSGRHGMGLPSSELGAEDGAEGAEGSSCAGPFQDIPPFLLQRLTPTPSVGDELCLELRHCAGQGGMSPGYLAVGGVPVPGVSYSDDRPSTRRPIPRSVRTHLVRGQ